MGKQLAITENGKHIIGKKLFITDENLKHRKGKKAFLTVGGVHRLVYSSGVEWAKYSCNYTEGEYYEIDASGSDFGSYAGHYMTLYDSYEFSSSEGYYGVGATEYYFADDLSSAIGKYLIDEYEVCQITSLVRNTTGSGTMDWEYDFVARCERVKENFQQGSKSYGTIEAEEGALPEEGTLIEGSVADGYCVLEINGTYYYYVIN